MGHFDTSAVKVEETVMLHLVESAADIKAAVADLIGEAGHKDVKGFGTGGIKATLTEEADDALR